ncbi:MAG TPA: hypothetical protein VFB06_24480 [Streptosporangiaceae bacterium]|nr:hypothetical protein [Streptosporangiaceae bacterium]
MTAASADQTGGSCFTARNASAWRLIRARTAERAAFSTAVRR